MDHLRFKSDQTAAAYVADELDAVRLQEFELHMMSCQECLEDVEGWRAIKNHLPREAVPAMATAQPVPRARTPQKAEPMGQRAWAPENPARAHEPLPEELPYDEPLGREPLRGEPPRREATPRGSTSEDVSPPGVPPRGIHVPDEVFQRERAQSARPRTETALDDTLELAGSPATRAARKSVGRTPPPGSHERRAVGGAWRFAAMLTAGLIGGGVLGWYGRSLQGPAVDADRIGFYSLPPLVRGPADCMSVPLDSHLTLLALRVPGAMASEQLVPVDSEGHDLRPDSYSVRTEGDGTWLVRLPAATVREQGIRFEARSADGTVEPRGCVVSATQP